MSGIPVRFLRAIVALAVLPSATGSISGCASGPPAVLPAGPRPALAATSYTSFDGDRFPYRKWLPERDPRLVVIGFHGIAGASSDFRNLGEYLVDHLDAAAVYAPDLRGQGNDPFAGRQGDIRHPEEWFYDALTFTRLVRARHPGALIVWCGESMGSLIALHAAASVAERTPPCDALVLSSPIARIRDDAAGWKRMALRIGAALFPKHKVSLEELSGEEEVRVIKEVVHQEQVETNPYHISAFTLRLLNTLGNMIEAMPAQARRVSLPVLLLHGGHDIFSKPKDVAAFQSQFAAPAKVDRAYYPESYHLLFYDHQRERVLADIARWLRRLPAAGK